MKWPPILKREHVQGAEVFADRYDLIRALSGPASPAVAEIGVAFGDFSRFLIETLQPSRFHAFDVFNIHEFPTFLRRDTAEIFRGRTHLEYYEERFAAEKRAGILTAFQGDSSSMLGEREDRSYDIIYVDGAHDYDGVKKDADAALAKIKLSGVLVFNDYILIDPLHKRPYGVVQVVNDLCVNHGWKLTHFALQGAMFCDVALRRRR